MMWFRWHEQSFTPQWAEFFYVPFHWNTNSKNLAKFTFIFTKRHVSSLYKVKFRWQFWRFVSNHHDNQIASIVYLPSWTKENLWSLRSWTYQMVVSTQIRRNPLRHGNRGTIFLTLILIFAYLTLGLRQQNIFLWISLLQFEEINSSWNVISLPTENSLALLQNDVELYLKRHKKLSDDDNKTNSDRPLV